MEITAKNMVFEAPEEIPSGWTRFVLKNEGTQTHFFLLNRLPEGKTFEDYHEEVTLAFGPIEEALRQGVGQAEIAQMLVDALPQWFWSVKQMGGVGFVAPGRVASATLKLEPGRYAMECYVMAPNGVFHASMGMVQLLTVTNESTEMSAPEADIELTLSNYEIAVEGALTPGEHTVAVHFKEHPEVGFGNDVHLVRLEDDTDMEELVLWMNWMNPGGLQAPAPAEFLGGVHEMPVGHTAYFSVDLKRGRYAWIAESTADDGMVKEFIVK